MTKLSWIGRGQANEEVTKKQFKRAGRMPALQRKRQQREKIVSDLKFQIVQEAVPISDAFAEFKPPRRAGVYESGGKPSFGSAQDGPHSKTGRAESSV
jgi:hypothetical protein